MLHVNSGEKWNELVKYTLKIGIFGLENLALIPGLVGSAPINNIGAYGLEFKDICSYIDLMFLKTKKIKRIYKKFCYFGYRHSIFKTNKFKDYVIISVGIKLYKKWKPINEYNGLNILNNKKLTPHKIYNKICSIRKKKIPNPKNIANAGSFFKNPIINYKKFKILIKKNKNLHFYIQKNGDIKIYAGWLIEKCNLKGTIIGGAQIHNKQALIIINKNNATPNDIISLARKIRNNVAKKFNIWLEPEVRLYGSKNEKNIQKL
ncbi:UDP-N-acetylmuramate dehydrogenase [Buchnera aphidicola (Neophyllaphis varicolor)]|uniref:UDP-N-acetylmuramate dehydrogenase n=2 Tax=Buchnera aphidicola TaxID=9 RepID=UPI0031B8318D